MASAAWWRRIAAAPLWIHSVALGAVLVALLPLIGTGSLFVSDEGAVQAQVELVAETGEWTLPNEHPELDPDMEALPIDRAERTDSDRWAPYVKHPAYVAVLTLLHHVAGAAGALLLGIAGTALAALAAATLVRAVDTPAAVPVLWATGLLSPLAFDAYLTMAHAPAAALCGWAAVALLRWTRTWGVVLASVLVSLATLVRAEAVLFGVALAIGGLVVAVVRGDRVRGGVAAVAIVAAAFVGRTLNALLVGVVLDGTSLGAPSIAGVGSGDFFDDRISGLWFTLIAPNYGAVEVEGLALVVAAALVALVSVLAIRRPADSAVGVLALCAVALALLRATDHAETVPGLLLATPWLASGWVAIRRQDLRGGVVLGATATWTLFMGAVLLTQYGIGGGGEWGGRYFALGLVAAVVPSAIGLRRILSALPAENRRRFGAGLVGMSVVLTVLAVMVLSTAHSRVDRLRAGVSAARRVADSTAGQPVPIIGTSGFLGRAVWRPGDPGPFFSASGQRLQDLFERFEHEGVERALLVSRLVERDVEVVGDEWSIARDADLGFEWHALTLVNERRLPG